MLMLCVRIRKEKGNRCESCGSGRHTGQCLPRHNTTSLCPRRVFHITTMCINRWYTVHSVINMKLETPIRRVVAANNLFSTLYRSTS